MTMINSHDGAAQLLDEEKTRADAGIVFLVGMLLAGALTVGATLALADAPAGAVDKPAAVATR